MSPLAVLARPEEQVTPFELVAEPRTPTFRVETPVSVARDPDPEAGDVLQARALVARFPGSPTALSRLAQALMFDGQRDEAVSVARSVGQHLGTHPDLPALLVAGYVLLGLGEPEMAEALVGENTADGALVLMARCAVARGEVELAPARLKGLRTYDAARLSGSIWMELAGPSPLCR